MPNVISFSGSIPNFNIEDDSLMSFPFPSLFSVWRETFRILILVQDLIMALVYKLGVLGDVGVGKTALISQFIFKKFVAQVSTPTSSRCFAIEEFKITYI
jgi:hypothetical protein